MLPILRRPPSGKERIVFWSLGLYDDTVPPAQQGYASLLISEDGQAWRILPFGLDTAGSDNYARLYVSPWKKGGRERVAWIGPDPRGAPTGVYVYSSEDLVDYIVESPLLETEPLSDVPIPELIVLRDGAANERIWAYAHSDTDKAGLWERKNGAWVLMPLPSNHPTLKLADALGTGFDTLYAAAFNAAGRDTLYKWTGSAWQDQGYSTVTNIVWIREWKAKSRLLFRDYWNGSDPDYSANTDPIRSNDGSIGGASKVWVGQYTGGVIFGVEIGKDFYFVTRTPPIGVNATHKLYRATSLTATPLLLGSFTDTGISWSAVVWYPPAARFYWAIMRPSPNFQIVYRSEVVPLSAGAPNPTGLLTWEQSYQSTFTGPGWEIRDGVLQMAQAGGLSGFIDT